MAQGHRDHCCCCASVGLTYGAINHSCMFCRLVLYVSTADLCLNKAWAKKRARQLPLKIKYGFLLNMLLRIRLSSFLAGVAVAGTFSLYQIRQDIQKSHELLSAQVRSTTLFVPSLRVKMPGEWLTAQVWEESMSVRL